MAVQPPAAVDLSVVIPVYRSAAWIERLVDRVLSVLTAYGGAFEIILVNDASPGRDTRDALDRVARREPAVRVVHVPSNAGQFLATLHGLALARGALVVTMDDDFQHAPEDIPTLVWAMAERPEVDCVVAAYRVKRHSWLRKAGSRVNAALLPLLLGRPRGVTTTSFRVIRRDLAHALVKSGGPQIGPQLRLLARRIESVPVTHHERVDGRSGYSILRLVREALKGAVMHVHWFNRRAVGRDER